MYEVPDGLPTLSRGGHESDSGLACVMEYISVISGSDWSDHPDCTDPVLGSVAISCNDQIVSDEERSRLLVPFVGRLVGTAHPGSDEERLAYKERLFAVMRETIADTRGRFDMCNCDLCETNDEQALHGEAGSLMATSYRNVKDAEAHVREVLLPMLSRMLDVADEVLGRSSRVTESRQALAEFVAAL